MKSIEFSEDIEKILNNLYKQEKEKVETAIDEFAGDIVNSLKEDSPKMTGKYAGSWKITQNYGTRIIHNTRYRLTHLLEDGFNHIYAGKIDPQPHIQKAYDKNLPKLLLKLKK